MTSGLIKERITYFHENGIVYQAFNSIFGAKIFLYIDIGQQYICAKEFSINRKIENESELKSIAIENEFLWEAAQ